jgi:hypothetical protein
MADQTTKCHHAPCRCQINTLDNEAGYQSESGEFCSIACQQGVMSGGKCGCGHPECG